MFALGNVKAARRKCFPAWMISGDVADRQDQESRARLFHEVAGSFRIKRRHPAVDARAKIPDQTRFMKVEGCKFHLRFQITSRLLIKLRSREKWRGERRDKESNDEIDRRGYECASFQKLRLVDQMSREQKRKQRKGWKRIMRQLCFDQSEDDENNSDAAEKVDVDLVPAAPKFFCERRQFDRPRKKAGEDRDQVERQKKQ